MTIQLLLLALAFIAFIIGVVDHPRVSAVRMIALGLALLVLVQLVSAR